MSNMRESELQEILGDGELWDLDVGAIMVHNAHVQAEKTLSKEERAETPTRSVRGCGVCSGDVATLVTSHEAEKPGKVPDEQVGEGAGGDEEGTTTPARSDEAWWRAD